MALRLIGKSVVQLLIPRSLVACAEDHLNKITKATNTTWRLSPLSHQQQRQHLEPNANYTCHSKFGPLHYFTAGVTQYFHTMKRKANEWVPKV